MKREREAGKSATVRGPKFKPMPLAREAWAELRHNLSVAIRDLDEDEYLILLAKGTDHFVQFAGQGAHGMRAEAVSNTFIKRGAPLSETACRALVRLGWSLRRIGPWKLPKNRRMARPTSTSMWQRLSHTCAWPVWQ